MEDGCSCAGRSDRRRVRPRPEASSATIQASRLPIMPVAATSTPVPPCSARAPPGSFAFCGVAAVCGVRAVLRAAAGHPLLRVSADRGLPRAHRGHAVRRTGPAGGDRRHRHRLGRLESAADHSRLADPRSRSIRATPLVDLPRVDLVVVVDVAAAARPAAEATDHRPAAAVGAPRRARAGCTSPASKSIPIGRATTRRVDRVAAAPAAASSSPTRCVTWTDELRQRAAAGARPRAVPARAQLRPPSLRPGRARRRPSLASPLDFRGDVTDASLKDWRDARGRFYVRLDYADIALWREWMPLPIAVDNGKGALRAWFDFAGGAPDRHGRRFRAGRRAHAARQGPAAARPRGARRPSRLEKRRRQDVCWPRRPDVHDAARARLAADRFHADVDRSEPTARSPAAA